MITIEDIRRVALAAWRAAVGHNDANPLPDDVATHPVYLAVANEMMAVHVEKQGEAALPANYVYREYPKHLDDGRIANTPEDEARLTGKPVTVQPPQSPLSYPPSMRPPSEGEVSSSEPQAVGPPAAPLPSDDAAQHVSGTVGSDGTVANEGTVGDEPIIVAGPGAEH